jgi:drug/metabolite transporter (DMT)-like permease
LTIHFDILKYQIYSELVKPMLMIGAVLALLGLLAIAMPVFTTNDTKNVATLGDLKIQANEQTSHAIPPILSGAALIAGLVMVAGGLYQKR